MPHPANIGKTTKNKYLLYNMQYRFEFFTLCRLQQFENRCLDAGDVRAGVFHLRQADVFVSRRAPVRLLLFLRQVEDDAVGLAVELGVHLET